LSPLPSDIALTVLDEQFDRKAPALDSGAFEVGVRPSALERERALCPEPDIQQHGTLPDLDFPAAERRARGNKPHFLRDSTKTFLVLE
jgi:hypothetical protein